MSDLGSEVGEMVGCAACKSKEMALVGMGFGWGKNISNEQCSVLGKNK